MLQLKKLDINNKKINVILINVVIFYFLRK